jgi:hypothetical protein
VSEAYANELENWFSSFPSIIQDPIRPIFNAMNEGLKWVAGNPQELVHAGEAYAQLGENVHLLVRQQFADRSALAGHWSGVAYDAFTAKMQDIELKLDLLAESTKKTKELLEAAAQAAVDGANMIIDIIVSVLSLMLAELAINAALAAFTAGASLLALVAEWIAAGVRALSQILRVVGKVAEVLEKLCQLFVKLEKIFKMVASFFRGLKELLAVIKGAKEAATGLPAKAGWFAAHAGAKFGASKIIDGASGGYVTIPGVAGEGWNAIQDYRDASHEADRAVDAAQ